MNQIENDLVGTQFYNIKANRYLTRYLKIQKF